VKKQFHRIPHQFFRLVIESDKGAQTLALFPDELLANEIGGILQHHFKLREGQRINVFPSAIRPASIPAEEPFFNWNESTVSTER